MVKILPAESYLALLDVTTYLCWYFIQLAHYILSEIPPQGLRPLRKGILFKFYFI